MGGRKKREKPQTNSQASAGRGAPAPFTPAPNPPQSAWGRPAPAPSHSARGAPAPAPVPAPTPAQSAWGRPGPAPAPAPAAPAPTQSAWGMPTQAVASTSSNYHSSSRVHAESGRPRDQPQQPRQQQGSLQRGPQQQQEPHQPGTKPGPRTYFGHNESKLPKVDRGGVRNKEIILYPDIVVTKNAGVSKKGKTGETISLTTNYFRLVKKPDWQIYQYRVDFSPPIDNDRFKKKLIKEQKIHLGGYLFDGTVLFLCKKLHKGVTEFMTKDRDENPIQTTVKFVRLISMLNGESVQILNLILRRSMAGLNLQLVGRNFFDSLAKIDLNMHRMQLWPGYSTSIRQHEVDILMCAQVTTKVMRTETVYDILLKYRGSNKMKDEFTNAVMGMIVLTAYNNTTYKIDDVTFEMTPQSTFNTKQFGTVTFVDYYQKKYNIKIRSETQPMLITRSKPRGIRGGEPEQILLIPELCRATGFTDEMRNNRRLMEDVARYTRLGPAERIKKLMAFNTRLQTTAESMANFQEWNFQLDKRLVQLNGRELPVESVIFGNKKLQDIDWSYNSRNASMYSQQPLKNWVLIVPKRLVKEARDFLGILYQAANGMNYEIREPHTIELNEDYGKSYMNAIDLASSKDPQLIMCILQSLSADKYSLIKKRCIADRGIASQVMLSKTITPKPGKDMKSVLTVGTKVAIQINTKLGGCPWMVNIPQEGIMVVGFDVCHDTDNKSNSYGALVATMDMKKSAGYFSAVSAHINGEELCNSFALNMTKAVTSYRDKHGYLPQRIFIYRDGVGEGQTDYVREHEINAIQEQLNTIYQEQKYKLLFVIVSKRINTRFFKNGVNPNPGTVVDDVVTLPERHDFFMISQLARNGTVSPTNYNILHNTSALSSDDIQKFTYKMTYLYYNWSSTLAVPAVCQYAHKLAFLVGTFIHRSPSHMLDHKLFFL